jgi:lysophospholipase L1-like esterase
MKRLALGVALLLCFASSASAQQWVASWTGAAHGPYPLGNPTAQPELRFAFPTPAQGARDQTFRLIVKPDVWGAQARIRLTNAFGLKPVTFDDVFVGLQESGAAIVPGTNAPVLFNGRRSVNVMPGDSVASDPVPLAFVKSLDDRLLRGHKLGVSFHVAGESGPMTWHAKALQTSYVSAPGSGSKGSADGEAAFPFSTTSWYFLDALEMFVPSGTRVIVAFGDSITDGTGSTLNGDDRWPDVLSRRLHEAYGDAFAVVNQGIDGNQVVGPAPADYAARPIPGGPAAITRLDRDIISLPGAATVIWMEGINDFAAGNASVDTVIAGYRQGVAHLRHKIPGLKIIAGTLTPALNSTPTHGRPGIDAKRKALNEFLRTSKTFDSVIDFDAATLDGATGDIGAIYQPSSSIGGPGDGLHPNRADYAAMANAVDLKMITGR